MESNSNAILSSTKLKNVTDLLTSKHVSIKNFHLSKAHNTVWNFIERFHITKPMRVELDLLTNIDKSLTALGWIILSRNVI